MSMFLTINWGHTHFRVKIVTMMKLIQEEKKWWVGIDSQLRVLPNQHLAVCLVSAGLKRAGTLDLFIDDDSRRPKILNSAQSYLRNLGLQLYPQQHPHHIHFMFSKGSESLSKLVRAFEQKDHQRIGEALDFPLEARTWFHPEERNGYMTRRYLQTLERDSVTVPSWIAYCQFVVPPSEVLRDGECARTGRRYEQFVFDYDRKLALAIRDNNQTFLEERW